MITSVCDHIGWVSRCSVRCGGKTSLRLSSSADGPPAATSKFRVRVWVRVRVRVGVRVRVKVRVRVRARQQHCDRGEAVPLRLLRKA